MLRAIGGVLGWLWRGLDGLRKFLHLLLLLAIFAIVMSAFSRHIPIVPEKSALVVAPQGPIVEQLTGDALERSLAEALDRLPQETMLRDVVDAIEAARKDDRISALYLDLGSVDGGGLAKLEEVASAVRDFRKSGKPVIAYGDLYTQPQYYVAANADQIYLDPKGWVYIDGFGNYGSYFKDAIDKLSIDWNVFRVGEYKSAVEPFTRNDMSPAEREASLAWLNSIWGDYKQNVATARGLGPQALQTYADETGPALKRAGGSLAKTALDARLVTALEGRYQVEERLAKITGEGDDGDTFRGVDLDSYLTNVRSGKALGKKSPRKVEVIVASGEIVPGEDAPGTIGGETLAKQLRAARKDDDVKAVVLRIDSPGGSVFASEVIRREIEGLRKAGKPIVASMSSLAASGGYYIAMDCDRIVASPVTLTGSIGIFAMFPTVDRALARLGVHSDGVGTTALSDAFRPDRPVSEATRQILQQNIEYEYQQFIGHVARARKQDVAAIDKIAQGRVWSGADAKRLGLVDQLGGYRDAIKLAAELAGLGKDYDVVYDEPQPGFGDALGLRLRSAMVRVLTPLLPKDALPALPRALTPLVEELRSIERLSDPRGIYSYCLACRLD